MATLDDLRPLCLIETYRKIWSGVLKLEKGVADDIRFTSITGYSRAEVLGNQPSMFRPGPHSISYFDSLWQGLAEQGHWSGEIWSQRKNGEIYADIPSEPLSESAPEYDRPWI